MAIFEKADFWGLKNHQEVRVQHETCSTICGTPVPAILNQKNSTEPAAGAREGQFMAQKWPEMIKEVLADTELSKINVTTAIEM